MATKYLEAAADFPGSVSDIGGNVRAIFVDTDNELAQFYDRTNAAWLPLVTTTQTQTLTNKTLTTPTITTPTITSGVLTSTTSPSTIGGQIQSDIKVLAANAAFTSNVTLTNLTGMSWTVVAGATYKFRVVLPATMTTNGGLSVAFKYTTATLTSIQVQTYAATASDNTTAVSTQSTTTADQTKFFDSKTAAYTLVVLEGTLVVNAGGTLAVQVAQNTSHADTTTVLLGAFAELVRAA